MITQNLLRFFIFWLHALCCYAVISTSDSEDSLETVLSECIVKISSTYFNPNLPLTIQASNTWHYPYEQNFKRGEIFLQMLSQENFVPRVIVGHKFSMVLDKIDKIGSIIIFLPYVNNDREGMLVLEMILASIHKSRKKNSQIIIGAMTIYEEFEVRKRNAKPLLIVANAKLSDNAIVLFPYPSPSNNSSYHVDVFGWLPEEQKTSIAQIDNVKCMDTWIGETKSFLNNFYLFPIKALTDMGRKVVNVAMNDFFPFCFQDHRMAKGSFFFVLMWFCEKYNCRVKNTGIIDSVHIVFPTIYEPRYESLGCEFTHPQFSTQLQWFVPSGTEIPRWQSLVRTFSGMMWVFVAVVFATGVSIFFLIESCWCDVFDLVGNLDTALTTVTLTHLGLGVSYKCTGLVTCLFFTLWLFYCLLINTAYQSALLGQLISPGEYPPIRSHEELMAANIKLKTTFYFTLGRDSFWVDKIRKYEFCHLTECFVDVERHKDQAVLSDRYLGMKEAALRIDVQGKHQVLEMPDLEGTMYFLANVRLGSCIFRGALEKEIQRLESSGIIKHWNELFLKEFQELNARQEISFLFSFSLNHLQGPFYVLLIGLVFALVVFVSETLLHHFK
ncbi:Ionotropic receptor 912 [Blattella germanica]|nr:Ionotropic receptor 912 [Blattella germanica]